ncbi:MAG: hypothetical protein R6V67_05105 [Spirochaetia bacterium]
MEKPGPRYLKVALAVLVTAVLILGVLYLRMSRVIIITDPVWRSLVLEGEDTGLSGLRFSLLKRGFLLDIHEEGGDSDSVLEILKSGEGDVLLLSPGLSQSADDLDGPATGSSPEGGPPDQRRIIAFSPACNGTSAGEEKEGIICIFEDLSGAMRDAGSTAAENVDTRADEAQLSLVFTDSSPRINRYADAFVEGWREKIAGGSVERIELHTHEEIGEVLREKGAGGADFVWIGGSGETEKVLERLDEWAVPSCVTGAYAAAAYPDTIKIEVRYVWKDAVLAAIEKAVEEKAGDEKIKLRGELRTY